MRVILRVDASTRIGSGHLMRCLTLAAALREGGGEMTFLCRDLPGNLIDLVLAQGFPVQQLAPPPPDAVLESEPGHAAWLGVPWQSDAAEVGQVLGELPAQDWLIVDSYALDRRWEGMLRPLVGRIMVIDDLADRPHDCDLLLDQNLYAGLENRYDLLVPDHCVKLLGPRYALLRPEFRAARSVLRQRDGRVQRIIVFFGANDLFNDTAKTLEALSHLRYQDIAVDVVVGKGNPQKTSVEARCAALPQVRYHVQVDNMAELLSAADLSIGAGGVTNWERFAVGTPSIIVAVAENQEILSRDLGKMGLVFYLGRSVEIDSKMIQKSVERAISHPEILLEMQSRCMEIVDGSGAAVVADYLLLMGAPCR